MALRTKASFEALAPEAAYDRGRRRGLAWAEVVREADSRHHDVSLDNLNYVIKLMNYMPVY